MGITKRKIGVASRCAMVTVGCWQCRVCWQMSTCPKVVAQGIMQPSSRQACFVNGTLASHSSLCVDPYPHRSSMQNAHPGPFHFAMQAKKQTHFSLACWLTDCLSAGSTPPSHAQQLAVGQSPCSFQEPGPAACSFRKGRRCH